MYYLPDMDFGRQGAVFVPFFGIQAATLLATAQLAKKWDAAVLPILLERLEGAAPNQFPMYAEQALPVIDAAQRAAFVRLLEARLATIEASAKRTRVEKVLRRARA